MSGTTGKDVSGRPRQHDNGAVHERTALLGTSWGGRARAQGHSLSVSPRARHFGGREEQEYDDDELDEQLLLARTASISSAVGLAPEAPEAGSFQHHQRRMSMAAGDSTMEERSSNTDYDAEGAPLLSSGKYERQYLYNTNYGLFITIFLSVMLGNFVAIFDGTIMASSHPV